MTVHIAQVNIARMKAPLESPVMAGFVSKLGEINALADGSPGFVWRLQTEEGNATDLRPYEDERILFNLSVWESVEALKAYVYRTAHAELLRDRRAWFEQFDSAQLALWWVPAGHIPGIDEAKKRLAHMEQHGPSQFAFTFKSVFTPDEAFLASIDGSVFQPGVTSMWSGSALRDPASLGAFIGDARPRAPFRRVLMVDPAHFQVHHVINPHMEGMIGTVDPRRAREEWSAIRAAYEELGFSVQVVEATDDFPDLVFAANQLLPFVGSDGRPALVLSHMATEERQGEVAYLAGSVLARDYPMHPLRTLLPLEGTGDGLWHPGKNLLWGGHGFRTDESSWEEVASITGASVVPLTLIDDRMYHLDVALMPVDETTAFSCRGAFDEESWARLEVGFPRLIEVPAAEAESGFALNGHCPDGKTLLLPAGNPETRRLAESIGLSVRELPTREFQRSGGSIFCLKNMLP